MRGLMMVLGKRKREIPIAPLTSHHSGCCSCVAVFIVLLLCFCLNLRLSSHLSVSYPLRDTHVSSSLRLPLNYAFFSFRVATNNHFY